MGRIYDYDNAQPGDVDYDAAERRAEVTTEERWGDTFPYQGCEKCRHGMHRHAANACRFCACPMEGPTGEEIRTMKDHERRGYNDGLWQTYSGGSLTDADARDAYDVGYDQGTEARDGLRAREEARAMDAYPELADVITREPGTWEVTR